MIQFMKAMRDDKGEMVRNAHLLGFFRRICKLLFLRTKPVFVFDGGTPSLKRRTVIARRRQRENAQAKIRKTAEKLLLNHLKTMRLKELAKELENQRQKNNAKGKKGVPCEEEMERNILEGINTVSRNHTREALDEMLAASLLAEEDGSFTFTSGASTSGAGISADEDGEEDEEMILPTMHGKVDPTVLAALPPSMQLDLLGQMRERLMAENRQKYQKVKKVPERFSELQIQSYLKTVAFRREIDEVQKSAAGRGIGGVQTSRIASEANREFIFSSSFTGDKEILVSAEVGRIGDDQHQTPTVHLSSDSLNGAASTESYSARLVVDEPGREFDDDVETYLDEMGRVRVSRVRAMGIRMTRDLQRNLDLMREIEQERMYTNENLSHNSTVSKNLVGVPKKLPSKIQLLETSEQVNYERDHTNKKYEDSASGIGTSIEISFEDDVDRGYGDKDDDLFAHLVAGDQVMTSSYCAPLIKQSFYSASDCEWEEGVAEKKDGTPTQKVQAESNQPLVDGVVSDESEVEWEEGFPDVTRHTSPCSPDYRKMVSKGALEEEANFQEAIRRSLGDLRGKEPIIASAENEKAKEGIEVADEGTCTGSVYQEENRAEPNIPLKSALQQKEPSLEVVNGNDTGGLNLMTDNSSRPEMIPLLELNSDNRELLIDKSCESWRNIHTKLLTQGGNQNSNGADVIRTDAEKSKVEAAISDYSTETSRADNDAVHMLSVEKDQIDFSQATEDAMDRSILMDGKQLQFDINEENLQEQMHNLCKEHSDLGEEQRRLERNAESVSSEMFAECQELLQMFGLPYIIAPMEAEAQCAYMELANLVDGVVTDDSDVFLFGARSVYKNIFDDRKYVETYFMKDIENELGLDREKLIRMALLLGSDYTEGVSGIGIVNAIEVVNAFPEDDGLHKFREWIESPDPTILGKVDLQGESSSKKKVSKVVVDDVSCLGRNVDEVSASNPNVFPSVDHSENVKHIFKDKHRNVSKNWHIPSCFPSEAVISAYASPQVDKSTEPYSWGRPDLSVLRKLCWEKFGWNAQKADELLVPVLKEYNKHETQMRLEAFYTFNERFAKIRSKRIKKAVKGIAGNKSLELMVDSVQDVSKSRKKRRVSPNEAEDHKLEEPVSGTEGDVNRCESSSTEKLVMKQMRKKTCIEPLLSEMGQENTNGGSNLTGRGRMRGRGRKGGRSAGRGRRKGRSCLENSEGSSEDGHDSSNDMELQLGASKNLHEVRRSTRPRRDVQYTVDDLEIDELGKADSGNGAPADEKAGNSEACGDQGIKEDTALSPTVQNHDKVGDPYLEDLSRDHGDVEGGFCVDEAKLNVRSDQLDLNKTYDNFCNAESSKEYLTIGGGFCLDEDEADRDRGKCISGQMGAIIADNPDPSCCSGIEKESEHDCSDRGSVGRQEMSFGDNHRGSPNATINLECFKTTNSHESIKDDDFEASAVRLSAMPNLRRKRRKS